jgi:hypothetical protein
MAWWRSGQLTPHRGILRNEANLVCDGLWHWGSPRTGFFALGESSISGTPHTARNRKGDTPVSGWSATRKLFSERTGHRGWISPEKSPYRNVGQNHCFWEPTQEILREKIRATSWLAVDAMWLATSEQSLVSNLENNFQLDGGAERQACDAIHQAARALLFSKDLLQQVRGGVSDFRLIADIP